jgi:polyhydroxyalkanoate synthesis regulator phasin
MAVTDQAELLATTLTRIEVKVCETAKDVINVLEKVTAVQTEVITHREKITVIESHVQQLQSDAKAAAKGVIDAEIARKTTAELLKEATAAALSEAKAADEKKVLDAKTLVEQSTTTWTKRQTYAVIGGFILAVIVGIFGIVWAIKTGTPPPKLP